MKKLLATSVLSFILLAGVILPIHTVEAQGIVPDCQGQPCDFDDFTALVDSVVSNLVKISIPIVTLMFLYAGVLFITAAGDTGKISKAKSIFTTSIVGFLIVLSAWLIVKTVIVSLIPEEGSSRDDPDAGINEREEFDRFLDDFES